MNHTRNTPSHRAYLACESRRIYLILIFIAGFYGAFTYSVRGGVFCNAQTGNFVLMAMELGQGKWMRALYYLVPISAYFLGALISEYLPPKIREIRIIRWETGLVLFEILVVLGLGALPQSAPVQISQVAINFICSMQYNTFRQSTGVPMATTFCTNHLRQLGIQCAKLMEGGERAALHRQRLKMHLSMIAVFVSGGVISAALCVAFSGRAIYFALIPLGYVGLELLYADLHSEKLLRERVPGGH